MKTKVTVTRSAAWLRNERFSWRNAPEAIVVEVEVAELSEQTRQLLLDHDGGEYPHFVTRVKFDGDYRVPSCGGFDHYGSFGWHRYT